MDQHPARSRAFIVVAAMAAACCGSAFAATEIKGAAILDHPCGKVSVKHMALVHAGKMQEANQLGTKELQEEWRNMPANDRAMVSGMMKEISQPEAAYTADIKSNGVLAVDGASAVLTVKKTTKDKSGTATSTMTQRFKIDGTTCLIAR